jgi:hypothetical protein
VVRGGLQLWFGEGNACGSGREWLQFGQVMIVHRGVLFVKSKIVVGKGRILFWEGQNCASWRDIFVVRVGV